MRNGGDAGKVMTTVGASFFVLLAAALSLSLYGEAAGSTKTAVFMVCAVVSALVFLVGRYLQSAEGGGQRHRRQDKRRPG